MTQEPQTYDAFISYSHAQDRLLAQALQAELEAFARPWYRPRTLRVFRDSSNLAATPALWPTIEDALKRSTWFVLMASPGAAGSRWVADEVTWWTVHKPTGRMLIALTDGEIAWTGDDFDWSRSTALPPALAGTFASEPLWIDLRKLRPDEDTAARPRLGDIVAEFAAPIRGQDKDALVGEHIRRQRTTRRLVRSVIAALSVLLLIAAGAAVVAVNQRNEARHQRTEAVEQARTATSRALALQSRQMLASDLDTALLLAAESYRTKPTKEAREALLGGLMDRTDVVAYLRGHRAPISAVAVSPDGTRVASGGRDGTVHLWHTEPNARPTTVGVSLGRVARLAFTPDGRILAVAGENAVALVDVSSPGAAPTLLRFDRFSVDDLVFSGDGRRLAAVGCRLVDNFCSDGLAKMWDLASGERIMDKQLFAGGGASSAAFSPDRATLAVGSAWGDVFLVTVANGSVRSLSTRADPHPDRVDHLVYSDDGGRLTSSSGTETPTPDQPQDAAVPTIVTWDLRRARPVSTPVTLPPQSAGVGGFTIGVAGRSGLAVTGGDANVIRVWRADSAQQVATLSGHHKTIHEVAMSADERLLASGDESGLVIVWRMPAAGRPAAGPLHRRLSKGTVLIGAAFSPDGRRLAVGGADSIDIWHVTTGRRTARLRPVPVAGFFRIAFSPDGATLAAVGLDGESTGVGSLASTRGWLGLWDTGTGEARRPPVVLGDYSPDLAFAPDGAWLAVGHSLVGDQSRGAVSLVNPLTGVVQAQLDAGASLAASVAVSHDGRSLAAGTGDGRVRLWDPAAPQRFRDLRLPGDADVIALAFSPDGSLLAIGQDEPSPNLHLADVRTGALSGASLAGVPGRGVSVLAFSPDGATLAAGTSNVSGNPDGLISLWDVQTRLPVVDPVAGLSEVVSGLAVDPSRPTFRVAATDQDGVVIVDLSVQAWLDRACAVAARNLTPAEWTTLVGDAPYRRTCG